MTLIANRPTTWNQVVGQARQVRILHALLRTPKFLTRGFIFDGPWAVGKTSCARLFGRSLMCRGDDPLGCGRCTSCVTADESLEGHPNFLEVDAAKYSSVKEARELLDQLSGDAYIGARWVVVIDEAHRLSVEAFDVFLKPLELRDTSVVFLFVTTEGSKIPGTIASRCSSIRFGKVDDQALAGMLMSVADREGVKYRHDGLKALARFAQGRPRDAIKGLGLVAALGEVTPESVDTALNYDAETITQQVYTAIVGQSLKEAIARADELAQRLGPVKVVSLMFSAYCNNLFVEEATPRFAPQFAPLSAMTTFFIKWCSTSSLPSDIIPLFILELNDMRAAVFRAAANGPLSRSSYFQEDQQAPPPTNTRQIEKDRVLSPAELLQKLRS